MNKKSFSGISRTWVLSCFALVVLSLGNLSAQTFNTNVTVRDLDFPANEPVFYAYVNMFNLTGSDMMMGWEKTFATAYPSAWDNTIQDPDSFYTNGEMQGQFLLTANPPFPHKIICQFYPNNQVASAKVVIRIFPLADTTDYLDLTWNAKTHPATALDPSASPGLQLGPNPFSNELQVANPGPPLEFSLLDVNGKLLLSGRFPAGDSRLNLSDFPPSAYFLKTTDSNGMEESYILLK